MQDLRPIIQILRKRNWVTEAEIVAITGWVEEDVINMFSILRKRGLDIIRDTVRGYRLIDTLSLIDIDELVKLLTMAEVGNVNRISVFDEVDSTNNRLMEWDKVDSLHGRICIAEYQTSGRGRYGRSWISSGYKNLTISIAWRITRIANDFSSVSLAVGLAICFFLEELVGEGQIKLKWPNDIICPFGKLAGVLVETRIVSEGQNFTIIGIGLNVSATESDEIRHKKNGYKIASLSQLSNRVFDRTELIARLIIRLNKTLDNFNAYGFSDFRDEWNKRDLYYNDQVISNIGKNNISGKGFGVDSVGAYCVRDSDGHLHKLVSGEMISLREPG